MAIMGMVRSIVAAVGGRAKDEDRALRPRTLAEYNGQDEVRGSLQVYVRAALARGEALDHVLVSGPAGLGKTTLAEIVANEMGAKIVRLMGPMVKEKSDLIDVLIRLGRNDVLFIDEIHALSAKVAEVLYTAMEDNTISISGGGTCYQHRMEPFTLVGATTNSGRLLKPLRDRFGIKAALRPYDAATLAGIVQAAALKLGTTCAPDAAAEIARRSQGVPRLALSTLRRVRDWADNGPVDLAVATVGCERAGYDKAGLNEVSRLYLRTLVDRGVPTALGTMVSVLGETKDVIEDEVEPYLLSVGFIEKTGRGRIVTRLGTNHLANVSTIRP